MGEVILSAILGKVMGGWKLFGYNFASTVLRKIDGYLLGLLFAYLLQPSHWLYYILIAVSVKIGEQPGHGYAKGWISRGTPPCEDAKPDEDCYQDPTPHPPEWYVVRGHPWISITIRGLIYGIIASLPFLAGFVLGWEYKILLFIPFYIIAMPLALWLGLHLPKFKLFYIKKHDDYWLELKNAWNWSEPLQQVIVCVLIMVI